MSHSTARTRNFHFELFDVLDPFDSNAPFSVSKEIILPFSATHLIITNQANEKALFWSFNKNDIDGILIKNETPITFDGINVGKIYFNREAGGNQGSEVRLWAWRL